MPTRGILRLADGTPHGLEPHLHPHVSCPGGGYSSRSSSSSTSSESAEKGLETAVTAVGGAAQRPSARVLGDAMGVDGDITLVTLSEIACPGTPVIHLYITR